MGTPPFFYNKCLSSVSDKYGIFSKLCIYFSWKHRVIDRAINLAALPPGGTAASGSVPITASLSPPTPSTTLLPPAATKSRIFCPSVLPLSPVKSRSMSSMLSLVLPPPPPTPRHATRRRHHHAYSALLPECVLPANNKPLLDRHSTDCSINALTPLLTSFKNSDDNKNTGFSATDPRPLAVCKAPLCEPACSLVTPDPLPAVVPPPPRPPPLLPKPRTNPHYTLSSSSPLSPSSSSGDDYFGPFSSSSKPAIMQSSYVNLAVSSDHEATTTSVSDVITETTPLPPVEGFLPLARSQTLPHFLQTGSATGGQTFSASFAGSVSQGLDLFGRQHARPSLPHSLPSSSNPFRDPLSLPPQVPKPPVHIPKAVSFAGEKPTGKNPFRVPLSQIPALEPGDRTRQLGELFFARLLLTSSGRSDPRSSSSSNSVAVSSSSSRVPRVIPTNISDPLAAPAPPPAATLPPIRKTSQVR
jgi:hypothetical protein